MSPAQSIYEAAWENVKRRKICGLVLVNSYFIVKDDLLLHAFRIVDVWSNI